MMALKLMIKSAMQAAVLLSSVRQPLYQRTVSFRTVYLPSFSPPRMSLSSRDLPSSKPVQPLSVSIPDDQRSIANSTHRVPAGPANPNVLGSREDNLLQRLLPNSNVLDTFSKVRKSDMPDLEALRTFIKVSDFHPNTLKETSSNLHPALLHRQLICIRIMLTLSTNPLQKNCQHLSVTSHIKQWLRTLG
jgi:hypothetical protein